MTDESPFREDVAHITDVDGTVWQVLNGAGDDWDEPATRAVYEAALQRP